MASFKKMFREHFANQVCRHYDKYVQFVNPVEFDVMDDIYRQAYSQDEWDAFMLLQESEHNHAVLNSSRTFNLYLPNSTSRYVQFSFPKGEYPFLDISFERLSSYSQDKIRGWVKRAASYKALRSVLYKRTRALVDNGMDSVWDENAGGWRGGGGWIKKSTPGQGCNTPGQVNRIWPELTIYLESGMRAEVRNSNSKPRLPRYLGRFGTPDHFRGRVRPCHSYTFERGDKAVECGTLYTDEEWKHYNRCFEGLSHILTQMSLMKDVPRVANYPIVHI